MGKRTVGIIAAFAMVVMGVGWLVASRTARPARPAIEPLYAGKIHLGHSGWEGYFAWRVAVQRHMFQDAGLDVEVTRYASLAAVSKDFVSGKLIGRSGPTVDILTEYLDGFDQRIVAVIDYSAGADNIIAKQEIGSPKDFQGKRVAYEAGILEEFFLSYALKEHRLSLADVIHVEANAKDAVKLLAADQADVAVTYEPFGSQLATTGPYHLVYTSADAPGLITDALAFRADFVKDHPATVSAILKVYFQALQFWKDHPQEALTIVAKEFGMTPEALATDLHGITMLDVSANRAALTFAAGLQSIYGNMRQIGEFVAEHRGKSGVDLDTDRIIEPRFIRELAKTP